MYDFNDNDFQDVPFYENRFPELSQLKKPPDGFFDSPKNIYDFLDFCVYGHHQFKKYLSLFIWQLQNGHHPAALLVAGNSGEGKTETIRALKKIYQNIAVLDGASITPQGYKGANKFASGMNLLDNNNPYQKPILVIDEIDKLICRDGWHASDLTAELLKLMEGTTVDISVDDKKQNFINTENMGFILLGSFSHLTDISKLHHLGFTVSSDENAFSQRKLLSEELILDQLTPELIGRIGKVIVLDPFTQKDFEQILQDERYSPIYRFQKEYGIRININPDKCRQIAESAYLNQTGVRSMTNEIARYLNDELFKDPGTKEISI